RETRGSGNGLFVYGPVMLQPFPPVRERSSRKRSTVTKRIRCSSRLFESAPPGGGSHSTPTSILNFDEPPDELLKVASLISVFSSNFMNLSCRHIEAGRTYTVTSAR